MTRDTLSAILSLIIVAFFGVLIGLSILIVATTAYGIAAGYALPSTAIFELIPMTEGMITVEPSLSSMLLVVAASGATISWLGWVGVLDRQRIGAMERTLGLILRRWGIFLPLCILLIIINSGGWSGRYTGHPSASWSLFNLVPFSDAITYFGSSLDRATLNTWGDVPSRRPLAQALRDVSVFFADYSEPSAVLLQTILIAGGLTLLCGRIIAWKGAWAAVAFMGFVVCLLRGYLGTMMTEPLGWALVLFSLAYLCDAVRSHSPLHGMVALVGMSLALTVRAGSLLTLPYLIIWMALAFGSSRYSRLRWAAVAFAGCLAVAGLNALLFYMYSPPGAAGVESFGLTLCGISVGGAWGDCYKLYAPEIATLPANDRALAAFMLHKALSNIADHPFVVLSSLARNSANYIVELPGLYLTQFKTLWPRSIPILTVALLAGLIAHFWKRGTRSEILFMAGLFVSTLASAAIIYADDGFRAMQVTYAALCLPLSFAFASPVHTRGPETETDLSWRAGVGILMLVVLLALSVPGISHEIMNRWMQTRLPSVPLGKDEVMLLGGRGISGFLVLPDGEKRPTTVPSTYYSDFLKVSEVNAFERDYRFDVRQLQIKPPFAFIIGMRANDGCCYYITAPDVLTDQTALAWHLIPLAGAGWNPIREMGAYLVR